MPLPLRASVTCLMAAGALALCPAPASAGVPRATADQPSTTAGARGTPLAPDGVWLAAELASPQDKDVFRFRVRGTRMVLVTLGDLPADYRLTLLHRDGRILAVSDRSGPRFEEIVRRLGAGEYYVEVATSGAAVTGGRGYRVLMRTLDEQVEVVDSHRRTTADMTVVIGQLLNNTSSFQERPRATAYFYDGSGALVASATALAERTLLGPGERAAFRIVAAPVPGAVRHVVRIAARATAPRERPQHTVESDEPFPVESGSTRYVGRIGGAGQSGERLHVHLLRYNSYGALVDFGHAIVPVPAGRPSRYQIELPPYPYSTTTQLMLSGG